LKPTVSILISLFALMGVAHAQEGTVPKKLLAPFASAGASGCGLTGIVAFDQFDREVSAAKRPEASVRDAVLVYLSGKSTTDLPWTDGLLAMTIAGAHSPSPRLREQALVAIIRRNGRSEMRDEIVRALDDSNERSRDLAIGEVASWADFRPLLEGYLKRHRQRENHAETVKRALFLLERGGLKSP
jgi:hypothetical protein